jgi:DNA polymerase-3 subunit beta
VLRNGSTTAPAHTLYDIVRKLPDGAQVELETAVQRRRQPGRVGRPLALHAVLPAARGFPGHGGRRPAAQIPLAADDLKRIIDRTRFAISTEETRYYLNGIYLHAAKGAKPPVLRAVATDGHRLARVELPLPEGRRRHAGRDRAAQDGGRAGKLLDESRWRHRHRCPTPRSASASTVWTLTSKLIDGTFPDYERVIPAGNDKILDVPKPEFAQSVDRVSTISADKSRAVKLNLAKDKVTLSAVSPDAAPPAKMSRSPTSDGPAGDRLQRPLPAGHHQQIEGKEARFLLADAGSPAIIERCRGRRALYVLMPMRV